MVSTILFLNQPTIGHLNTLLTIALQMEAERHQVQFVVPSGGGIRSGIKIFETADRLAALLPAINK